MYEGEERRKLSTHCIHENDWGKMMTSVENLDKRINGSLHQMEKHMEQGHGWRVALIGVIIAIFIQIIGFAYLWGGMSKQVEINTGRLTKVEALHEPPKLGM